MRPNGLNANPTFILSLTPVSRDHDSERGGNIPGSGGCHECVEARLDRIDSQAILE